MVLSGSGTDQASHFDRRVLILMDSLRPWSVTAHNLSSSQPPRLLCWLVDVFLYDSGFQCDEPWRRKKKILPLWPLAANVSFVSCFSLSLSFGRWWWWCRRAATIRPWRWRPPFFCLSIRIFVSHVVATAWNLYEPRHSINRTRYSPVKVLLLPANLWKPLQQQHPGKLRKKTRRIKTNQLKNGAHLKNSITTMYEPIKTWLNQWNKLLVTMPSPCFACKGVLIK